MSRLSSAATFALARPVARRPCLTAYERQKRVLDVFLVLMAVPVVVPLVAVLGLLVSLDGGPALFGHRRVGQHGQGFRCWKLRSMRPDAEARLARVLATDPKARVAWVQTQKLPDDPRVTRLGRILRRTSLDELPQLWNVLCGEMSLVGPRPVTPAELHRYGPVARSYLALRPGVSGLWQVSGRNHLSYEARVALDQRYYDTRSLRQDAGILLRTLSTVLRGSGQ